MSDLRRPPDHTTREDHPDAPETAESTAEATGPLTLTDSYCDDADDIFGTTADEDDPVNDTTTAYLPEAAALVAELDNDPYRQRGPLGERFDPGVHNPVDTPRHRHELRTAEHLAAEGADVRLGPEEHALPGVKHVDSIVRTGPDDPGTFTELKAIRDAANPDAAMKNHIAKAVKQLEQHMVPVDRIVDGHVVVDGRDGGVTEADVLHACRRLVGQANAHGRPLPRQVRFILQDGSDRFFDPSTVVGDTGDRRFAAPDDDSLRSSRDPRNA